MKEDIVLEPLRGFPLGLLTFSLGLGTFIQVLDSSIANVALPTIAGQLGVSPDMSTWVITAFAASNAVVLPLTGWLAGRLGPVHVFVMATFLFSITSWLCGLAPSLGSLVFFRTLQGAVAGSLIPLSQTLLLTSYPKEKASMALAFWAMVVIIAPITGPILGGWITENYGWSWIFFINVPLGILSSILTWKLLKERERPTKKIALDWGGCTLLILGVSSLQICLDNGERFGWFESPIIIFLAIFATINLIGLVWWQLRCIAPVIDFSFFRDRNFRLGLITSTLGFSMFFSSMVLLPMWLQNSQHYTAFWAGLALSPIGFFSLFLSPLIGKFLSRIDLRLLPALAFAIFSFTFFWFSHFTSHVSFNDIVIPRFVQGIGVAGFFIPLVSLSLSGIAPDRLSSASGLFNFVRILFGTGIGTSIFVALFNHRVSHHQGYLVQSVSDYNMPLQELSSSLESQGASPSFYAMIQNIVDGQASILALNDIFWFCGWTFLAMIALFLWCAPKLNASSITLESSHPL